MSQKCNINLPHLSNKSLLHYFPHFQPHCAKYESYSASRGHGQSSFSSSRKWTFGVPHPQLQIYLRKGNPSECKNNNVLLYNLKYVVLLMICIFLHSFHWWTITTNKLLSSKCQCKKIISSHFLMQYTLWIIIFKNSYSILSWNSFK